MICCPSHDGRQVKAPFDLNVSPGPVHLLSLGAKTAKNGFHSTLRVQRFQVFLHFTYNRRYKSFYPMPKFAMRDHMSITH